MKNFILAAAILVSTAAFGQIESNCTVYGNTVRCTSTDTDAERAVRTAQYSQAGHVMGAALGAGIAHLVHRSENIEYSPVVNDGKEQRKRWKQSEKAWCPAHGTGSINPFNRKTCK